MDSLRESFRQTTNATYRQRLQELVEEGEEYTNSSRVPGCAEESSEDVQESDLSNGTALKVSELEICPTPLESSNATHNKTPNIPEVSSLQASLLESDIVEASKKIDTNLIAVLKELSESFEYARERDTQMSSTMEAFRIDLLARVRAIDERLETLASGRRIIDGQTDRKQGVLYGPREQTKRRASGILDLFRPKSVEDLQFLSLQILHKIKNVEVFLESAICWDRASEDDISPAETRSCAEQATDEMLQLLTQGDI